MIGGNGVGVVTLAEDIIIRYCLMCKREYICRESYDKNFCKVYCKKKHEWLRRKNESNKQNTYTETSL